MLLAVRDLQVSRRADGGVLLGPLDLDVAAGECVAVVGESGAGKSLATLALLGLLPPALQARGRLLFAGRELALGGREHDAGELDTAASAVDSARRLAPRDPAVTAMAARIRQARAGR